MTLKLLVSTLVVLSWLATSAYGDEEISNPENHADQTSSQHRAYYFGLGVAKITEIGNSYNHYEQLFSTPSFYPEFWGEYSVIAGWGFDLSLGVRVGFYKDRGNTVARTDTLVVGEDGLSRDIADDEVDRTQTSNLSLLPVQGVLNVGFSPFSSRWLVANVWSGVGLTYVENTTKADLDSSIDQSDVSPYINSGWNRESLLGFSLSIDVSYLDPWDAYSLRVHGIDAIYLTPFYQTVVTTRNVAGIYDRKMIGLMFTFETRK